MKFIFHIPQVCFIYQTLCSLVFTQRALSSEIDVKANLKTEKIMESTACKPKVSKQIILAWLTEFNYKKNLQLMPNFLARRSARSLQ